MREDLIQIENTIRATLVVENKESIPLAARKIAQLMFDDEQLSNIRREQWHVRKYRLVITICALIDRCMEKHGYTRYDDEFIAFMDDIKEGLLNELGSLNNF